MPHDLNATPAPPHAQARLAGLFYLAVVITGVFSLAIAPQQVFAGADPAARLANVLSHDALLRWMIVAEAACYIAFAGLALALHRLLAPAGPFAAALMAALVLISVPIGLADLGWLLEILRLANVPTPDAALIEAARARYFETIFLQSIPWGLWLMPFGYLVIRCGFLPRALGVVLILAGLGYVAHFVMRTIWVDYGASGVRQILAAPRIGEMLICGWLLIFGARRAPWPWGRKPES